MRVDDIAEQGLTLPSKLCNVRRYVDLDEHTSARLRRFVPAAEILFPRLPELLVPARRGLTAKS